MEENKNEMFKFGMFEEELKQNSPSKEFVNTQITDEVFNTVKKPDSVKTSTEVDRTSELVETALHAGIVHKVKTENTVKERILKTADKVISTNLSVAESKADKADKEAFFNANKDACSYFGYDEKTTDKGHVGLMKGWAWVFNFLYICTIGFFLVGPIVFFMKKLQVAIKHSWLVLILAILIYALIILTPFLITWLGRV